MNMHSRKWVLSGVLLALATVLAAAVWMHRAAAVSENSTSTASQEEVERSTDTLRYSKNAPQLDFLQISKLRVYPEPLTGAFNAQLTYDDNFTARVYSPIAGRVVHIRTEMGRHVRAGDPLIVLNAPDYAQAVADNTKAEAERTLKRQTYARDLELLKVQGIARKDVEAAKADMLQANAEALRARARLRNLTAGTMNSKGEYVLRAPIAGIVSERAVSAGSEVRPDAANPLFVITDPKRLWLQIDLPESQLGKTRIGQPVSIEVDAYPGEVFPGKVTVIGEEMDPVTRRVNVRCEVMNQDEKLRPGMFARATPVANESIRLPRVPNTALITQGLYSYVFVENSPGVLQRRRVELGIQGSEYSYVTAGLHAGDQVVTSGALLLDSELSDSR